MTSLPFKTGSFSSSLCLNTLLNLNGENGLGRYLAEISRVTQPGGKVCIEVRNSANPLVIARFLFGRIFRGISLNVHRMKDVERAGRGAGLVLSSRESVGPVGGIFSYSYILVFRKEDER
jgi:ubiquinone/menaquinone biosynthesis C-methylase UbiE